VVTAPLILWVFVELAINLYQIYLKLYFEVSRDKMAMSKFVFVDFCTWKQTTRFRRLWLILSRIACKA